MFGKFSDFLKILWPDTWHLRHWLHCWQLRTTITLWPLNKEWRGQHLQFLQWFQMRETGAALPCSYCPICLNKFGEQEQVTILMLLWKLGGQVARRSEWVLLQVILPGCPGGILHACHSACILEWLSGWVFPPRLTNAKCELHFSKCEVTFYQIPRHCICPVCRGGLI